MCENFLTDTEFIVSRLKRCDKLDKGVNHEVVNLYDLKQMGNKGGCTIQLIHHFPFGMGLGHLKKDYIEFKRVGIFDGKAVEVTLREPYSRDLVQVVKSIK